YGKAVKSRQQTAGKAFVENDSRKPEPLLRKPCRQLALRSSKLYQHVRPLLLDSRGRVQRLTESLPPPISSGRRGCHHNRYQATCGPAPRAGRSRTALALSRARRWRSARAISRARAAQRWHKQAGVRCEGDDSNDFISSMVLTIEGQCAL